MGSSSKINSPDHDLVLFDGVCNLCNGFVKFIIRRDPQSKFKFASLQSSIGKIWMDRLSVEGMETVILVRGTNVYQRSDACLEILRRLTGLWPVLYVFKIVPRFLRDPLYTLIARHRYRIFGKKESCMIPTPELKSRFVE